MNGISYISTARPDRRGGGCAITANNALYHLKETKCDNPDNLEITFATLRPKEAQSPQFVIIGASVRRTSRSAFGRSTGNDVSGHYKRHYFLFSFFSSPSSTFLIEVVLKSKNLFTKN